MDDRDILMLFKEGQEHYAFNLLVDKYSERLYWHIRKMVLSHEDADDLLQDVLVKVWNSLSGFREESKLFTWLYRIATNEALTFIKRAKLRAFLSLTDHAEKLDRRLAADPYFNGDNIQRIFYKAISKLPQKQRAVFTMRYFEEMSYEDISEILGGSVGALKASYHHAYHKIQKFLREAD